MNAQLFAPLRMEIPAKYVERTQILGMGIKAKQRVMALLHQVPNDCHLIIFGTAGSLLSNQKPGDVFLVSEVTNGPERLRLKTNESLALPTAKLFTSKVLLRTKSEKDQAQQNTHAEIVDMETYDIVQSLTEKDRERLLIIRGIIDRLEDSLHFLNPNGKLNLNIFSIRGFGEVKKLLTNRRLYLKAMEDRLDQILRL